MGVFDPLVNGLWFALGLGKKHKKFKKTDPVQFKSKLGEFIIFNVSAINPNFIQGGIQGATHQWDDKLDDKGSFWQHTGAARLQPDGTYLTIEAFSHGVDYGILDNYLNDKYQLEAYTIDIQKETLERIWETAKMLVRKKYSIEMIGGYLVPKAIRDMFINHDRKICSAMWTVIMDKFNIPIVRKNISTEWGTPGDVHDGCYPQRQFGYSSFNF